MSIAETKQRILATYTSGDPRGYVALANSHSKLLKSLKLLIQAHDGVYRSMDGTVSEAREAIKEAEGE